MCVYILEVVCIDVEGGWTEIEKIKRKKKTKNGTLLGLADSLAHQTK